MLAPRTLSPKQQNPEPSPPPSPHTHTHTLHTCTLLAARPQQKQRPRPGGHRQPHALRRRRGRPRGAPRRPLDGARQRSRPRGVARRHRQGPLQLQAVGAAGAARGAHPGAPRRCCWVDFFCFVLLAAFLVFPKHPPHAHSPPLPPLPPLSLRSLRSNSLSLSCPPPPAFANKPPRATPASSTARAWRR